MAKSQVQRNKEYQERNQLSRLDLKVSTAVSNRLDEIVGRNRVTKREMLERLIRGYGEPHAGNAISLSDGAREKLEGIARRYLWTIEEVLKRLIHQGIVTTFPKACDKARELLEQHGGDRRKAKKALLTEIRIDYPNYRMSAKEVEVGGALYEIHRWCKAAQKEIERSSEKWASGMKEDKI